jgi:uncharacterized membrane protein
MRTRSIRSLIYFAAGLGLLVALFAAAEFIDPALTGVCTVNQVVSCKTVADSGLTTTLGVQDWIWGVAGFVAILLFAGMAERRRDDLRWTYGLLGLTTAGVGLSMYLLYIEVFRIGAICPVCATAYFFGILAWVGSILLARRKTTRAQARTADPTSADAAT